MDYASVSEPEVELHAYFCFYHSDHLHRSLGYGTPAEVHFA